MKPTPNHAINRRSAKAAGLQDKISKDTPPKPPISRSPAGSSQGQSKQDRVVAMLRQKDGATIAAVMKATGWQKHSVHGFLAGVVRKRLGLTLVSGKSDGEKVYRIADEKCTKASPTKRKRAA